MTGVESGDPGEALQCLDVRTGGTFRFQARRLHASGVLDTTWTPDSTQVCVGTIHGLAQRVIPDGTGGAFIAWADPREGLPDVRLSRVDAGGVIQEGWSLEGRTLSPFHASRDQVAGCADGAGGAYVAWSEFRGATTSAIRLVRVGENGALAPGWPSGGVLVGAGGREQARPEVAAVAGGVTVAWLERRDSRLGLRVQRFGADGARVAGWSDEGAEIVAPPAAGHVSHHQVVGIRGGDLLVVWREESASEGAIIRAVKLVSNTPPTGALPAPRALSSAAMLQSDPTVIASSDHVFVAWTERSAAGEGVWLQRLAAGGDRDPAWPSAGVRVAESVIGFDPPAVLPQSDGGAILAWTDRRKIASGDIYAGRVVADGTLDSNWPTSGVPLCTALGDQFRPALAADGSGGAIVTWIDAGTQAVAGFMTFAVGAVGRLELVATTLDPGRVRLVWAVPAPSSSFYRAYRRTRGSAWTLLAELSPPPSGQVEVDDRLAPEGERAEYALSVERDGVERFLTPIAVDVPATPDRLALRSVRLSNSGDAIRVEFALPRGPVPRLELIDVAGRRVGERHLNGLEPGVRVAEVRGPGRIRAGVYFVRLHQGPVVLTQKFVAVP